MARRRPALGFCTLASGSQALKSHPRKGSRSRFLPVASVIPAVTLPVPLALNSRKIHEALIWLLETRLRYLQVLASIRLRTELGDAQPHDCFSRCGWWTRNAAGALESILEDQCLPWNVRLLNLQELLQPIDFVQKATGLRIQDGYNLLLRKGWTRLTPQLLVILRRTIQLHHARIVRILGTYSSENPTDLVLSVIPHFNRCLAEGGLRKEMPRTAFVTLLTDLADYPPNFWIEHESEFIICGSERAKQQALSMGHSRERIYQTSGMVLKPSFYRKPAIDPRQERARLGLEADLPTGIVMLEGTARHRCSRSRREWIRVPIRSS